MKNNDISTESTEASPSKALLITIQIPGEAIQKAEYRQQELKSLVQTMGMICTLERIISIREFKPAFLIGTGKVDEIITLVQEFDIECIIFDQDLSPSQQRNWEKKSEICVIDRREVILQIFADRASTREAVLQVALARQQYSLPRLTRAWTHLSRQRGGAKGTRGEGETQLENDRRIAMKKISRLKSDLEAVRLHRATQRKQRQALPVPTGSIVGYTNAGKSSLLKILSGSDVYVEDKLFATLDPSTRRIILPGGSETVLTDTVGFVQDLPHDLISAFQSTLEETKYADFLIHIIDASHEDIPSCYQTTMEVLASIECAEKPMILVCNKMDLCDNSIHLTEILSKHPEAILASLKTGKGIDEILTAIDKILFDIYPVKTYNLPVERFDLLAFIRKNGSIIRENYDENMILVEARVPDRFASVLTPFLA